MFQLYSNGYEISLIKFIKFKITLNEINEIQLNVKFKKI